MLLAALAMVAGLAACKHPDGPYGWPTPDGWTWTSNCDGYSVTNGADRTICVDPNATRHYLTAAHELAHAWDMVLGTHPLRTFEEQETVAWCVAELLTGEPSEGWWQGVYYGRRYGCPHAGQVWSDAQLMYAIIVG